MLKRSSVIDSMSAIAVVAAFVLIYQSLISLHWIYQYVLNHKESYLLFNDHETIELAKNKQTFGNIGGINHLYAFTHPEFFRY